MAQFLLDWPYAGRVSDRVRVWVVGTTADDGAALARRLNATGAIDVARVILLRDFERGVGDAPADEAVVFTPRASARPAPRPVTDAPDAGLVEPLTARERDVLALAADGRTNREIAADLDISEHTVKFHLASIFGKVGASSRTEAVRRGLRLGLVDL